MTPNYSKLQFDVVADHLKSIAYPFTGQGVTVIIVSSAILFMLKMMTKTLTTCLTSGVNISTCQVTS